MLSYLFLTPTCLSNSLKDLKWPEINYDVIIQDLQGVGNIVQDIKRDFFICLLNKSR